MTIDRLVSPPKNEPVRMRTSICGRGQRAFQNGYIFRPDDAREERKVWRYSVLSSLTVERKWRKFSETTPRPRLFTPPIFLRILSDSVISRSYFAILSFPRLCFLRRNMTFYDTANSSRQARQNIFFYLR